MELRVLACSGLLPERSVLSVSLGRCVQRQFPLEVPKLLLLPKPDSSSRNGGSLVEVMLLQELSSQLLPAGRTTPSLKDEILRIPVQKPDGTSTHVTLQLRRSSSFGHARPGQGEERVPQQALEKANLMQHVQDLLQDVLRERPADPLRFMLAQLRKCRGQLSSSTTDTEVAAESHVAPSPPAAPRSLESRGVRLEVQSREAEALTAAILENVRARFISESTQCPLSAAVSLVRGLRPNSAVKRTSFVKNHDGNCVPQPVVYLGAESESLESRLRRHSRSKVGSAALS